MIVYTPGGVVGGICTLPVVGSITGVLGVIGLVIVIVTFPPVPAVAD